MTTGSPLLPRDAGFLSGGGEMGALMRSRDWSQTAVGPVSAWPQSLRTALSILLDSGYAMYIAWGREFTQFYNDAYRPILGARKHPAGLGQSTVECFAEIWDFIGPMFRRVLDEGKNTTLSDQLMGLDRNGYVEECYFTFSYSAIRDETGGVGGVLVTVIETTERVLEERRQHTLRDIVSRALEATNAEDVLPNTAQVLAANPQDLPFASLYLLNSEGAAVLAGSAGPRFGPDSIAIDDDSAIWPLGTVAATGRILILTDLKSRLGVVYGAAWPERVESAVIVPILNASHAGATGFIVAGINPRHALDGRYTHFLECVAEQTATALIKIRAFEEEAKRARMLAELDRAKTTFFSNVSHEFRTPLTLMLSPLEELLAMASETPARATELASLAHRNGLRLQKLVNSLLDFSRIEAGRVQVSYEPTDLASLTAEFASTFRSAIEKAGLALVVECSPLEEPVYVDPEMWEKIVLNLLSNALKYTFTGSISVRTEKRDGEAVLSVQDTGTGIPAHEVPRLFERFYRVEGARGRTQEGTGIGLALIAELVKLHGGKIEAKSTIGEGSLFTVSVPFGATHLPADRLQPAGTFQSADVLARTYSEESALWLVHGEKSTTFTPDDAATGRVMVVDDNADMREYISRLLADRYDVESAVNGEEALAKIAEVQPDVVLSDVMMPGLDGFGLVEALRKDPETRGLPVILVSARAGEEARVEGLDAGATDYLVKPFTARELVARVGSHMEMVRIRKQSVQREEVLRAQAQAERDRAVGILESITDGFFTLDRDWCFTYVNPAGESMMRSSRADLIGRNHWDLQPEAKGTIGEREYRRAVRDQVPVNFEFFHKRWQQWFAISAYPVPDGGLSIYFRDITDTKRAELQLRQQWEAFDTALSHTPDHIYTFDLQGRFTYANRAVLNLFGRSLDEFCGKDLLRLGGTREFSSRLKRQIRQVAASRTPITDHTDFTSATGETRHYEYILVPIFSATGDVIAIGGSTRDTTDRERMEKALAASEERLAQILAQAPVAIVAFRGPELIVEMANPLYRSLLPGRELIGLPLAEVDPELGQHVWDAFHSVLETGETFVANEWLIPYDADRDGVSEDHWFNIVYVPRRETDDSVSGMIAVLTDVTVQVTARREVERVNKKLEEFAYVASHDLQEPLRMVHNFTELLLRNHIDPQNEDERKYADFIQQGVRRMEQLIRDLLSYSRVLHHDGAGPSKVEGTADLNVSWARAVAATSDRISSTSAKLTAEPLPTVYGDAAQFSHVFQNLLSNALKYCKVSVTPEVSIRADLRDGKWVIAVNDNGIGFEPKYAERIFGLFKRLHREEYPGTGLGLAICQRIVERSGGRIWAESTPGAGSTFFVELPAMKD